jgi:hypothetical protein
MQTQLQGRDKREKDGEKVTRNSIVDKAKELVPFRFKGAGIAREDQ